MPIRLARKLLTIYLPATTCAMLVVGFTTAEAQDWLAAPQPEQIQSAVGALANAAAPAGGPAQNVTINTGKECCKQTLPELLGLDKVSEGIHGVVKSVVSIPVLHNFGHTVLYPAAGSMGLMAPPPGGPLGGAPGAGTSSGASAGGASSPAGAGPAPSAAGAPAVPGMPPAPGTPPPGTPPAPAPGNVLKGIKASQAAAKGQVAQIALLSREDAAVYPEIIPSILGSLDSPNEPVRYQCLKSLYQLGQPKHCTRARFMKTQCRCQQCNTANLQESVLSQPMVIQRLSRLLTDRTALGGPRETSPRVRRLAMHILEGILRPPGVDRTAVKPDPKYAARTPAARTQAEATETIARRSEAATIPEAGEPRLTTEPITTEPIITEPIQPPRRLDQTVSHSRRVDFEPTQMADHFESIRIAARKILNQPDKLADSGEPGRLIRDSAENYLAASGTPDNPTEADIELYQRVANDCFSAMELTLGNPAATTQFNIAAVLLTNARLQLAINGDTESVSTLTTDAEALREWNQGSLAAVEAALVVVDYAGQMAQKYGESDTRYLEVYARHAQFFAQTWPQKKTRAASLLVGAAELCELYGAPDAAAACYRMLNDKFRSHPIAVYSITRHEARFRASRMPVLNDSRYDEIRHASREAEVESRNDVDQKSNSVKRDDAVTPIAFFEPAEQVLEIPPAEFAQPPATPFEDPAYAAPPFETAPFEVAPIVPDHGPEAFYESNFEDEFNPEYAFKQTPLPRESFLDGLRALNISHEYEGVENGYCEDALCKDYSNIATENVVGALFEMNAALPQNVFRLRFDSAAGFAFPDRAEYLWPAIGRGGPGLPETEVDYQEIRAYNETAFGSSSAFMEVPLRFLDPENNGNTAGIGDLIIGSKTTMLERGDFRLTSIFKTHVPVGLGRRGLGHGHLALEPGLLGNWRVGCNTWIHGELDFYFPLGAHPDAAGEVLTFGMGVTNVLLARPWHHGPDSNWAVIGSLEFVGKSLLDGERTELSGLTSPVDQTIINIHPGLRLALSEKFDLGLSVAAPITTSSLYDSQWRFEMRWRY